LPTESEWEVASRAGARTPFGFGGDVSLLGRFGWFFENSKYGHPPRELRPSIRGLFDLLGNRFEWTHDWFGDYWETVSVDSLGPKEGSYRVVRGGCWRNDAAGCRTADRQMFVPTTRTYNIGFRLALSLSEAMPAAAAVKGAEPSGAVTEGATAEQRPEMP
jgi:formylglycine-generating enzyme required for sulfatase activity